MAVIPISPKHTKIAIEVKGAAGEPVMVACATGYSESHDMSTDDIRCLGQEYDAAFPEPGTFTGTATINGVQRFYSGSDDATNVGYEKFEDWQINKNIITVTKTTDVAGGNVKTYDAVITNVTLDNPGDANGTYTVSLAMRGVPVKAPIATP